jgi:orotidine-5'-phosphate decarboxylase
MTNMKERLIVALDVDTKDEVRRLVKMLGPYVGMFKVGLQLFTSLGPAIFELIQEAGGKVFVDLKLHDIPNTVAQASRVLTGYGVDMLNVHASGGLYMMEKAREAVEEEALAKGLVKPKLIAVTILTSLGEKDLEQIGLGTPQESVVRFAKLTKKAGLDGVVASPQETKLIRQACGNDFLTVTPGVRPLNSQVGDQKRITTPQEAIRAGSSYLVIGRPITAAVDPLAAVQQIIEEMEAGHVNSTGN